MVHTIEENLGKKMETCVEVIEAYNKKGDEAIEILLEQAKNSGSGALIASVEKLKQEWENTLRVSHKETVNYYEKASKELRAMDNALQGGN